ncbi:BolA family transcriptional regulator [Acinetobacter sp. B5B]|uniref:BolA family protein n=1 Tax=Acinetobacter baretiae TaxID=2605383 RepID=UPI0018C2354B|nr:BolA family protein [Acinetobacter baretiae]MBF7681784.1 BolA family transcriptional regulator [Acinetobacter baretiae]MBF7685393.1 BolA family transcriptional regulator [Acinetobacter baretiae]
MSLQQQLVEQLSALSPLHLEVINESAHHGGYFPGKESHFKVIIVSDAFEHLRLVQKHQKVYSCTQNLLAAHGGPIHALAIHAYSQTQWKGDVPLSPECAHAKK